MIGQDLSDASVQLRHSESVHCGHFVLDQGLRRLQTVQAESLSCTVASNAWLFMGSAVALAWESMCPLSTAIVWRLSPNGCGRMFRDSDLCTSSDASAFAICTLGVSTGSVEASHAWFLLAAGSTDANTGMSGGPLSFTAVE